MGRVRRRTPPHHRGNAATRTQLDRVRHWAIDHCGWRHVAGGRARDTGEEISEHWVPNPAKAFEPLLGARINGRSGGKWVDLTFEDPRTGRKIHVQTVDTDRHGKPTRRELENAETLRRRTGAQVILIPKR